MSLQVDPRGVKLLICSRCHNSVYVEVNHCPYCGNEDEPRHLVDCASSLHNESPGCDNPTCWKYYEYPELTPAMREQILAEAKVVQPSIQPPVSWDTLEAALNKEMDQHPAFFVRHLDKSLR